MNSEAELISKYGPENHTEDIYRLLIEGIKDYAIFLLDPNGHIVTWNAGAKKIKQYDQEEVIGKHFSIFYTPEAVANSFPASELEQALKNGRFEDEGWRVRRDGIVFWANVIFTPIYDDNGKHLGFSKVTRDLSERKKAEDDLYKAYEELKDSEERFRRLVEGVTDYAIFMLDSAGHVATWNEGARRIKGYESYEIIGKYFAKFYSRDSVVSGFPEYELKEARAKGRFEDEGWRYRKDGTAFWANVIITAIFNDKKELIGFSKITRDLTEKKQLEEQLFRTHEELRESEEKSRLLVDSVRDYAILMLNTEGLILSWNTGAERIKGYSAQEVIGKHFSIFYPREAIENGFPAFELTKAVQDGRFEDEGWRVRKDGTAFWANVVLSPVYNSDHRLLGFAKITRDLTERRRNEDLMQKNKELVRINNDLDNFVYTASHDLKSPIANLEGLLMALKEDMGADCLPHQKILTMMDGSLETLRKVINDLSDVTKLQQAKDDIERVNILGLLEEVKANLRDSIKTSEAELIIGDMDSETLSYSRKNLRSILYNLVSNAIKYRDPQRAPKITLSSKLTDSQELVLSVSDNGLGIPAHQVLKVFAMYKRVHDHVEGTGIGLYLVKKILDNSGDDIKVHSTVGQGTTFHVHFKNQQPR